jgi:hypothetical protein
MKILIVLTSHDQLGDTGKKTGFWLEELAAPYYVLKDAGAAITLASPKGGQPPLDPKSDQPEHQTGLTKRFRTDTAAQAELANTKKPEAQRFDVAVQVRNFEIDLFWKRSVFFWGFIASAFIGYAALRKDSPNLALLIACFGMVCSCAWTLLNRGSKYWQELGSKGREVRTRRHG